MSSGSRRRRRVEPTDDWEQLALLARWPEQVLYELFRPVVLFGESAAERVRRTGAASERTLRRRAVRFEAEGMESLFDAERTKRREIPPAMKRLVVDLKAEHPRINTNKIAGICYVRFGRRPDVRTVRRVLEEEPMPLRMVRRYPPYHEIPEARERRTAVVSLHSEGWPVKAIADYLGINRDTVCQILRRWIAEGEAGLEDRPRGRPKGVRKVDIRAIDAVRRLQRNPELGAFRVHAALKQLGVEFSPATCGRILALNRRLARVARPRVFETSHAPPQLRLFALDEAGWLKAEARRVRPPQAGATAGPPGGAVPLPRGPLALDPVAGSTFVFGRTGSSYTPGTS